MDIISCKSTFPLTGSWYCHNHWRLTTLTEWSKLCLQSVDEIPANHFGRWLCNMRRSILEWHPQWLLPRDLTACAPPAEHGSQATNWTVIMCYKSYSQIVWNTKVQDQTSCSNSFGVAEKTLLVTQMAVAVIQIQGQWCAQSQGLRHVLKDNTDACVTIPSLKSHKALLWTITSVCICP